jgi:hypothetical protein
MRVVDELRSLPVNGGSSAFANTTDDYTYDRLGTTSTTIPRDPDVWPELPTRSNNNSGGKTKSSIRNTSSTSNLRRPGGTTTGAKKTTTPTNSGTGGGTMRKSTSQGVLDANKRSGSLGRNAKSTSGKEPSSVKEVRNENDSNYDSVENDDEQQQQQLPARFDTNGYDKELVDIIERDIVMRRVNVRW